MKTPIQSVIMFLVAGVVGAVGQYLYKSGADRAGGGLGSLVLNGRILAGALCYIGVMVLFVGAFRRGGSLALLYPLYASTFIWGAVISMIAFGTAIRPVNLAGMALLVAGMYLMGR